MPQTEYPIETKVAPDGFETTEITISNAESDAFDAILSERAYQNDVYGDAPVPLATELVLLDEYLQHARESFVHAGPESTLEEIRKVAAIAFRALVTHGAIQRDGFEIA